MGDLQDRDRRILQHVARYRLTTSQVVERLFCQTKDATKKVLARLAAPHVDGRSEAEVKKAAESSLLQARPLFARTRYYQLTARGTRELGQPLEQAKPLGNQALVEAYAVLVHCCLNGDSDLLTASDLSEDPRLQSMPPASYYLARRGRTTQLTRILVDHRTDAASLIRRIRDAVADARSNPLLLEMLTQKAFAVAVLTLDQHKQRELRTRLVGDGLGIAVTVDYIPNLAKLIEQGQRDAR